MRRTSGARQKMATPTTTMGDRAQRRSNWWERKPTVGGQPKKPRKLRDETSEMATLGGTGVDLPARL